MDTNFMRQTLSAPVNLLRPSNEEERGVFHNKKGWFYTFGLESGPRFVARIDKGKDLYTFRPLDNSADPLVQFQWYATGTHFPGILPRFNVACETNAKATEGERRELERILGPKAEEYTEEKAFGFLKTKLVRYYYPEIFQRAYILRERLVENEAKKQQLEAIREEFRAGKREIQSLMLPNDNASIDQVTQQAINRRKQRNG